MLQLLQLMLQLQNSEVRDKLWIFNIESNGDHLISQIFPYVIFKIFPTN